MAETFDDADLVRQFNGGDDSAFDRIVERYAGRIAAMANRLLGWPGDVDDVTQDVFVSAYLGLKKFRGDCSLRSWLFTITINKCRSHRYKKILWLRRFSRPPDNACEIPGRSTVGDSINDETFDRVRRAVNALSPKYREVVVLRYLQELPTDEICRILGISSNALQVRLNRARERMRQQLGGLIEE
jgi:RNA polymerase sigma-70 factor (ECF subfamily)